LDGILVLAKPAGPTSHDMVALVRRLTSTKRVGHGGTLDPFAGGVLPMFLGRATRLVEYHLGDDKRYRATVCFGASSTTDDLEGELTPVDGPPPDRAAVEVALGAFRGRIEQVPPAYSAVKVAGRRAYAMARSGERPVLASRTVTIQALDLIEWDASDPTRPIAILDVGCSAGTYVRAIARDLGAQLGNAAYLGALTRTASGPFRLEDAVLLDQFRAAVSAGPQAAAVLLRPADSGLDRFPVVQLADDEVRAILRGQFVKPAGWHASVSAGTRDAGSEPATSPAGATVPAGAPLPGRARPPGETTGPRGPHYRLVDPNGALVAIAGVRGPRLAPEKVLQDLTMIGDGGPAGVANDRTKTRGPQTSATRGRRGTATQVVDGLDRLRPEDGPVLVVVGVFDGLHRGHLYLLDQLRAEAAHRSARGLVVTFDAHPEEILLGQAPPVLVDPTERLVRLGDAGVEITVIQTFDTALRTTPYGEFVAMISRRTGLAGFLMTPDAAFGHDRKGTPDSLSALGRTEGFEVVLVPPFEIDGRPVRSSEIRQRIAEGDLVAAAALLGRPVAVAGDRRSWPEPDGDRPGEVTPEGSASARAAWDRGTPGPETRAANLEFRLPVALPPSGSYTVEVEPAWQAGVSRGPVIRATAVVDPADQGVRVVADRALPPVARLRVSFLGRSEE